MELGSIFSINEYDKGFQFAISNGYTIKEIESREEVVEQEVEFVNEDGEILVKKGETISLEVANRIQNSGINVVNLSYKDEEGTMRTYKCIGNNTVDLDAFVDVDPKEIGVLEKVYYPHLKALMDELTDKDELIFAIKADIDNLVYKHITLDDIVATVSYNLGLRYGFVHAMISTTLAIVVLRQLANFSKTNSVLVSAVLKESSKKEWHLHKKTQKSLLKHL